VPADEEGAAKAPAAGQDRKAGGSNSSKKGKKDGKSKDGEYGVCVACIVTGQKGVCGCGWEIDGVCSNDP
jgi:hypothetical protein